MPTDYVPRRCPPEKVGPQLDIKTSALAFVRKLSMQILNVAKKIAGADKDDD